jgi:choline dehydrogenase-like flavoprotein
MPSAPSGNTNATVYAIAERAADLIHGDPAADRTPSRTA